MFTSTSEDTFVGAAHPHHNNPNRNNNDDAKSSSNNTTTTTISNKSGSGSSSEGKKKKNHGISIKKKKKSNSSNNNNKKHLSVHHQEEQKQNVADDFDDYEDAQQMIEELTRYMNSSESHPTQIIHLNYNNSHNSISPFMQSSSPSSHINNIDIDDNNVIIHQQQQQQLSQQSQVVSNSTSTFATTTTNNNNNSNNIEKSSNSSSSSSSNDPREVWIQSQLQLQTNQFTENRTLKVLVGSWNVNSRVPGPDHYLGEWLHVDPSLAEQELPDVIVVGLQEVDMSAQAMLKNETEQCALWAAELDGVIQNAPIKYDRYLAKQMVGLWLGVYIREQHRHRVKNFKSDMLGLGAMGRMGNKGGVGARFQLFENTFCFITAHFAPHMEATAKRNAHFHEIFTRLDFGGSHLPDSHDYLFWFGDLNYRIDHEIDTVKRCVDQTDLKTLLAHDQLTIEKFAGRVFYGFKEGPIHFLPTYKYDPGTLTFDTSAKSRTPSWCDRILWKGQKRDKVKQLDYKSYEILTSDHLPVASMLHAEVTTVVDYKYQACKTRLAREYDQSNHSEENVPDVVLNEQRFDFGQVYFDTPVTRVLKLKNVGKCLASFQFVPRPNEDAISKPWIKIHPVSGELAPGSSEDVVLTIYVDHTTGAYDMNNTLGVGYASTLHEILTLHINGGTDYFVHINGQFQKSCFANSLQHLVTCTDSIRSIQPMGNGEQSSKFSGRAALFVPKELWRLTDYIFKYGMRESGLFQETGELLEVAQIREILDKGESLDQFTGSIHSVSDALFVFLETLKDPIIPLRYYKKCMDVYLSPSKIRKDVISQLSPVHTNVFEYLMAFLREVLLNSDVNNLTPDQLAQGFAPLLFRSPPHMPEEQKELDRTKKIRIVLHFLKEEKKFVKLPSNKLFKEML